MAAMGAGSHTSQTSCCECSSGLANPRADRQTLSQNGLEPRWLRPRKPKIARTAPKNFWTNKTRALRQIACTRNFTRKFGKIFVTQVVWGPFSVSELGRGSEGSHQMIYVRVFPFTSSVIGTANRPNINNSLEATDRPNRNK